MRKDVAGYHWTTCRSKYVQTEAAREIFDIWQFEVVSLFKNAVFGEPPMRIDSLVMKIDFIKKYHDVWSSYIMKVIKVLHSAKI